MEEDNKRSRSIEGQSKNDLGLIFIKKSSMNRSARQIEPTAVTPVEE